MAAPQGPEMTQASGATLTEGIEDRGNGRANRESAADHELAGGLHVLGFDPREVHAGGDG